MFARLVTIHVKPGARATATRIGDEANALYRRCKGFVAVYFMFIDEAKGEYGSFSVWQTREDADAAAATHRELLARDHATEMVAPARVQIMEVYEPKPI